MVQKKGKSKTIKAIVTTGKHLPDVAPSPENDADELIESEESEESDEIEPGNEDASSDDSAALVPSAVDIDKLPAVSLNDPLRQYLSEIRKIPLLEPEQEIALVKKMLNENDIDAAKKLVQANLRLVVRIAFEYQNIYSNLMDLIQEGNIGLMKAVSKYDPTKGARLGYYASWWIRSFILKYILDNFRLIRVGTTQAQKKLFFHLMREKEKLEAQGIAAAPKLLAQRLQVKEKEVVEMEKRLSSSGQEMSLDLPVNKGEEGTKTWLETIEGHDEAPDTALAHNQWLQILTEKLPDFEKSLKDKERLILRERLLSETPKTLQEIGDEYGLTRERARQIEAKLIAKLRETLKDYID